MVVSVGQRDGDAELVKHPEEPGGVDVAPSGLEIAEIVDRESQLLSQRCLRVLVLTRAALITAAMSCCLRALRVGILHLLILGISPECTIRGYPRTHPSR